MPNVRFRAGLLLLLAIWSGTAVAAPRIDNVSLRGLQLGGSTTLVVTGAELAPAPVVWLGSEMLEASTKDGSTADRLELEVKLPREAFPGIRTLRISNELGISNPVALVVDELPESPWSTELASWPAALTGACEGATRLVTTLDGKRDQLLAVEVEARRLGSMLNPTVRVLDDQGAQLAWAQADSRLDGDARLTVTLPRDGKYTIELHDALFQGASPGYFRLKIADQATAAPPFLRAMTAEELSLRSLDSLLGGNVVSDAWRPVRTSQPSHSPTGLLRMFVSPWREAVEEEDARLAGPLAAPIGINGRLGSPGEIDKYALAAAPGATVRVQCIAERASSPLDGVLTVHDAAGNQLAVSDDQPGTVDPGLEFTMPAGPVTLALRDLRHRGGEEFLYRLSAIPADQPSFQLTVDADRYLIPTNGVAIVRVHADRQGNAAPISLQLGPLPAGIVAENAELPAGATDALVTLRSAGEAASGVLTVTGEFTGLTPPVKRLAQSPATALARFSPWLASEVAVATAPAAPLALNWTSVSAGDSLLLASNTQLGVEVTRAEGVAGQVRVTLITTQTPPTRQDNNQTVPDVPRTLRLAQDVVIPADQTTAMIPIAVPADLTEMPYDLALKAELLSADGAQVVATVFSPSRRLPVAKPAFTLELAEGATIAPAAENQLAFELRGKVVRPTGFTQAITVRVEGLPSTVPPPQGIVPEGQTEFTLSATLPATLTLGELQAAKLTAASELAPGIVIQASNEIPLTLHLDAAE
jgi:hypothetical protein